MVLNSALRKALLNNADSEEIREIASKNGMTPIIQTGIEKVRKGITSFSELARVLSIS
jgi:type IV pilus assembly protein PilB